ncbi:hypothetical protein M426DRAFT_269130 [Hypoxylon sp. CI-4A]|nr:hypothetical protein M426DRAFT_269130 [Hypoxylon sp. CI-4A]
MQLLLGLTLLASSASVAYATASSRTRGCLVSDDGIREPTVSAVELSSSDLPSSFEVDVNFHIASTEALEGVITDEIVAAQWDVLYENYLKLNITLRLNSTERVVDNKTGSAFLVYEGPDAGWVYYEEERNEYLRSTRKGDYDALNLYFFAPYSPGATGYCQFPTVTPSPDSLTFGIDSCQISALTMPGVPIEADPFEEWNLGHLAVHEAGHWFGLNHTFVGGCSDTGDYVADTPAQLTEVYGCPASSDTCPDSPGLDPIHNFMGYTDDNCTSEFTAGQKERIFQTFFGFRRQI